MEEVGEVEKKGEGGRGEETVEVVGRRGGVIRHHCLSPMPAGKDALALPGMAWNIWVRDGCIHGGRREREGGDGNRSPARSKHG